MFKKCNYETPIVKTLFLQSIGDIVTGSPNGGSDGFEDDGLGDDFDTNS